MKKILLFLLLPFSLFSQDIELSEYDDFYFANNEGLTITGTLQTSQQIAIIEKEQIERSGASDIANLLQNTLALNIIRHGAYGNQTGINLRGFDSKRVAFLINGIPVNSSLDGKFDISQIDINTIERIEVVYGGSDSRYNVSGAFGGVINIITADRQKHGLAFYASASNTSVIPGEYRDRSGEIHTPHLEDLVDTQSYTFSAIYGSEAISFTANIFANRAENHFLFIDRYSYIRRKDNNEIRDIGFNSSFIKNFSSLNKLIASTNWYYGNKNFPNSGFSANFGNQMDFSARQSLMFETPFIFHENLTAEFSLTWNFNRMNYTSPSEEISRHDLQSLTAINRWNWHVNDLLILRSGIDYSFKYLNSTEMNNRSRQDGGFYITTEYKPVDSFMLIPSAKIIFTSENSGNLAIMPKLGILWNITDDLTVKNNYFRNFKFPDFEELYWNNSGSNDMNSAGNPNLHPEDGWGADLGLLWHITKLLKIENTLYTQWLKNSIHWYLGNNNTWQPENVGEAVFFGLDNKIKYDIPIQKSLLEKITLTLSYNYLYSYLLSFGYTFASNKRIPYNPVHTIGSSVNFYWETGSLLVSGIYESLRYHDRANLIKLNPNFLLNASVNQELSKGITLFCSLQNILNTSYESFYDYPMPGITLTLGLRAKLEFK